MQREITIQVEKTKDMNLVRNNPNCTDCIYRKAWAGAIICDYISMREEARRDPVDGCTKKIVKKKRKRKNK